MDEDRFKFTAGCIECCKTHDFDIPTTFTAKQIKLMLEVQHEK